MTILILSHCLMTLCQTAPVQGTPAKLDDAKLARFLWDGYRSGREKLRSGVYTAHGRKTIKDSTKGGLEGNVEIFAAFDYVAGLRRFDRNEPRLSLNSPPLPSGSVYPKRIGGKLIATPLKNVVWIDMPGHQGAAITPPGSDSSSMIGSFDVRSLGLLYWNRDDKNPDLDSILTIWKMIEPIEMKREPSGFYRMTFQRGPGKRILWLDESKDFAPIRMETYQRMPKDADWAGPTYSSELTWTKISDVWVPKTYRNQRHINELESYDLVFDWRSVNEPVPSDLFDLHGMNLPKGTFVTETRNGKSYFAEVIGQPDYPLPPPPTQSEPARRSLHAPVLAAVGGIALVAVAAVFLARRRRRERQSINSG